MNGIGNFPNNSDGNSQVLYDSNGDYLGEFEPTVYLSSTLNKVVSYYCNQWMTQYWGNCFGIENGISNDGHYYYYNTRAIRSF
jgi:hypothetical protein